MSIALAFWPEHERPSPSDLTTIARDLLPPNFICTWCHAAPWGKEDRIPGEVREVVRIWTTAPAGPHDIPNEEVLAALRPLLLSIASALSIDEPSTLLNPQDGLFLLFKDPV